MTRKLVVAGAGVWVVLVATLPERGMMGLAARNLYVPAVRVRRSLLSAVCLGVVLGTPLLAAGITFSRALESFAALLLAVSVGTLGALQIGLVRALFESRVARMGMALSGASVLVGMLLAAAYALRGFIPIPLDISLMARAHGWLNGIGFTLLGLTSWSVERSSCSSR